jgi:hypothetical protein
MGQRRSAHLLVMLALVASGLVAVGLPAAQAVVPNNDDYANSLSVATPHRSFGLSLADATTEPSEPGVGPGGLDHTIWYDYTAPAAGTGVVDTCASTVAAGAVVYGDDGGFANMAPVSSAPVTCPTGPGRRVSFSFDAGATLAIQVGVLDGVDPAGTAAGEIWVWPVPANDLRGDATSLEIGTVDDSEWTTNATATHTVPADPADDPLIPGGTSGHTVWYQFTAPETSRFGVTLCPDQQAGGGAYGMSTAAIVVQHEELNGTHTRLANGVTGGCVGHPGLPRAVWSASSGQTYEIMIGTTPAGSAGVFDVQVVEPPWEDDPSTPPAISGSTAAGGMLTADEGTINDAETFRHQWLICTPNTTTCVAPYGSPTGKTYRVPACPGSSYAMRVRVTGTNWVGSVTTALSDQVLIPAHSCPAPSIAGPGSLSGVFKVAKATHNLTFGAGKWSIGCGWLQGCSGAATLKARLGGKWVVLGTARFTARAGATPKIAVHVKRKALKKLRKVRSAKGRLYLAVTAPDHRVTTKLVRLRVSHGKA